jgi:hypothetical protein
MAGGTFDRATGKVRPGTYLNYQSAEQASITGAERGTVLLPLTNCDYGPAGEIIELTAAAPDAAIAKLGYSVYDDDASGNMLLIREAFKKATTVKVYICTDGTAAAQGTGGWLKGVAKYKGARGNSMTFSVVANPVSGFDVSVYLGSTRMELYEGITVVSDLADSAYITFTASGGDSISAVASVALTGGTSGTQTNADITAFLDAADGTAFNTMAFPLTDATLLTACKTKIKYMRENEGKTVQAVVAGMTSPDYEGIINVDNGYVLDSGTLTAAQATAFVAGATAGASYTESNTYRSVEGALSVNGVKTHEEAVAAIKAGKFFFSVSESGDVIMEYDINSLVTFADGKGESYRKNRIIRVLDAFRDSITENFPPNQYDNNAEGWAIMEGVGRAILEAYESDGAITDVDYENDFKVDTGLSHGDQTYFIVGITPVDSAEKLFFTVTTR